MNYRVTGRRLKFVIVSGVLSLFLIVGGVSIAAQSDGTVSGTVDFSNVSGTAATIDFFLVERVDDDEDNFYRQIATVTTDESGVFKAHLPAGEYVAYVHNDAEFAKTFWGGAGDFIAADTFRLANGDTFDLDQITVQAGGRLIGTVVDDAGEAIPGLSVEALWIRVEDGADAISPINDRAVTDAAGRFVLDGLLAGRYGVSFLGGDAHVNGYYNPGGDGTLSTPVDVGSGETLKLSKTILPRAASLSGTVVDGSGDPIAGALVVARILQEGAAVDGGTYVETDTLGRFAIGQLRADDYLLDISAGPDFIPVRGASFPGGSLSVGQHSTLNAIVLDASATVQGRVIDSTGTGLAGLTVIAFEPGDGDEDAWKGHVSQVTDSQGGFALVGLSGGEMLVWVQSDGVHRAAYHNGAFFEQDADPIHAVRGSVTDIGEIPLDVGSMIVGSATDENGKSVADALVVASFRLPNGEWSPEAGTQTAPDGSFRIGGLPAGSYTVTFTLPSSAETYLRGQTPAELTSTRPLDLGTTVLKAEG